MPLPPGQVPPGLMLEARKMRRVVTRVTRDAAGNDVVEPVRMEEYGLDDAGTLEHETRLVAAYLACSCAVNTPQLIQVHCQAPACAAIICKAHRRTCVQCGKEYCGDDAIGAPGTEGTPPWVCGGCYDVVFPPSFWERARCFVWGVRRR